ncbi:uncharacterized protein LOC116301507 [Actinia tenebrosa]|uniref:Protein-tyrosine sulfotransferase n=1 Tax=Actinia tenebrosa TaxID=6105 RepID=A0A6P8II88_ACTTE|nr:uncharacterized protein LOC116301507 [Actinia tenebrosa]
MSYRNLCFLSTLLIVFLTSYMLWNEFRLMNKTNGRRGAARKRADAVRRAGKISVIGGKSLASNKVYDQVKSFVVFIGYPRSGHTLVSSLIDAHPHAIIANEFDIIGRWEKWKPYQRNKYFLFDQLYKNSKMEAEKGYRSKKTKDDSPFDYNVPGQWQGKFKDTLKVIGAKKGGKTTRLLAKKKRMEVMEKIMKTVKIPFKFLHVVRNPYDNIATMLLRTKHKRVSMSQGFKLNDTEALEREIFKYFSLAARNQFLSQKYKKNLLEIQSIELIRKPKETLKGICKFLGLSCSQRYLEDCIKIIFKEPSNTRKNVVWTKEQIRKVKQTMKRFSFLKKFTFESD